MEIRVLTSEKAVKAFTNIDDNVASKYLLPAIVEAQNIGLRGIIGDALLARCLEVTAETPVPEPYAMLIDQCQYYLAYKAVAEVLPRLSYKVTNAGVVKTADENIQNASEGEIMRQRGYYQAKADYYCMLLQKWLYTNRSAFPELKECDCNRIKANLTSSASCGIFLGGKRGRR